MARVRDWPAITFHLPPEQYESLREQAFTERRPMTEIIREAVEARRRD